MGKVFRDEILAAGGVDGMEKFQLGLLKLY